MYGSEWDKKQQQQFLEAKKTETSYASLRDVRNAFDQRRQAIENNWELPNRAKNLRLAQLKTELTEQWHATKKAVEQREHHALKAAWQKAHPTPNVADMTPGQVQARQEVLQDLTDIVNSIEEDPNNPYVAKQGRANAIMDLYARYAAQEYELGMDAVVQRGKKHLTPELSTEIQGMEDARKPHIAEARQGWQQLKQSQSNEGTARTLMQDSFLKETQLTSGESQTLHQATQTQRALQRAGQQQAQNEGTE